MMQNITLAAPVSLAAASASGNSNTLDNQFCRGVTVVVDITAITGTSPTLTVIIEGYDSTSGKFYTLLSSAALSAVGTTALTVYPGIAASANVAASAILPEFWRVRYTIGGTTPAVTATIGACLSY